MLISMPMLSKDQEKSALVQVVVWMFGRLCSVAWAQPISRKELSFSSRALTT